MASSNKEIHEMIPIKLAICINKIASLSIKRMYEQNTRVVIVSVVEYAV
jgi:hypothetical protein